ncbi:MAG TPA: NAD(P)H-binding protein [Rudaea sp.]
MWKIVVFGASGAVGRFLLPMLAGRAASIVAISRDPRAAAGDRWEWQRGDLFGAVPQLPEADGIVSLGPLDAFAAWFEQNAPRTCRRVLALGSMSAQSKRDSPDPHDRETAARLAAAETRLAAAADARGAAWTIFRPTLIYGAGVERTLAPIVRFARRWHVLPVPVGRCGLRQPVHARDLAAACVAAWDCERTFSKTYPLGGGERLPFDALLRRLRAVTPWTLPVPVPLVFLRSAAPVAARLGVARVGEGALRRLREDLIADNKAASVDFGYAPCAFRAEDVVAT